MAEQKDEQDKTEPATPFKLREARRRGQVAKSPDVGVAMTMTIFILTMALAGHWIVEQILVTCARLLGRIGADAVNPAYPFDVGMWAGKHLLLSLAPLLLALMVLGILASLLQTGPVFSFEPLRPDFKRLNPVTGLKRLFSKRALYDAIKTLIKLALLVGVLIAVLWEMLPSLPGLTRLSPKAIGNEAARFLSYALIAMTAGLFVIAVVDLVYTRWEYLQKMRMSRRELKDEFRRREGDPQIRSKRRELQQALRKRAASVRDVKSADVLITNPQHFAIALTYQREKMPAPKVVAKGAGELALRMREAAFRYRVAVVEQPPLARLLFHEVEIGGYVPEQTFPVVAGILRRIYAAKSRRSVSSA